MARKAEEPGRDAADPRASGRGRSGGPAAAPPRLYGLVVIGASAGGIEALTTLLGTLPRGFPVPIVVAQHLDPRHPSHLAEILGRRSAVAVRTVVDREALEPGVAYVVPADRNVEINDGHLRLLTDTMPRPKPSINLLLSSAADAYGERLIALILTGTGSDGATGARHVKAAGGTVIIENPATAAYPGMPASLAPTTVDLVADLEGIGPLLLELLAGTTEVALPEAEAAEEADERERALQSVLAQVRERTSIDFSRYKRPTLLRRLQRRMIATQVDDLAEYAQYLKSHSDEYHRLTASFLIKVTEFFRDTELFDALREQVLPELIARARTQGNVLRLWSAGCATGEEAYSLAILVAEALGDELERFQVQIFATDLDEDAVAFARRGMYPGAALAGMPGSVISRYFMKLDGNYEVTKQLRGLIIFGQHDLGQRPPFPHIDLVVCRNVLIYFTKELQARALQLFAFALRDGGYLALGKAETVRPLDDLFASISGPIRLYRRHGERVLGPIANTLDLDAIVPHWSARPPSAAGGSPGGRPGPLVFQDPPRASRARAASAPLAAPRARTTGEWLGNVVLGLPLGVVLVDRRYDIQAINALALRLLGIYTPALGEDLIHLTQSVPANALRTVVDAALNAPAALDPSTGDKQGGGEAVVTLETVLGERRHLHVACYPYRAARSAEGAAGETAPRHEAEVEAVLILIDDVTGAVQEHEREAATAEHLRAGREAERARERSDHERDIGSVRDENERLKTENARVGTVNRALLSANQDLTEVVVELRRTNEELLIGHEEAEANAEEVKTLNEEMQATNEEIVTINEELEATVEELRTANDDLRARGEELRQSSETLAAQRADAEDKRARLEAILLSLADAVLVVDRDGGVVLTNAAYADLFGGATATFAPADEAGRPLAAEATPQRRAAHGEIFTMEFTHTAADGQRRWFEASGQPIKSDGEGHLQGGVVAIRDVTERSLHRLEDEFVALASHELRTPLTPLNSYLQLLGRQFASEPADSRIRHYLENAQHQVDRLRQLVQDLLDVRRLRSGGFHLTMERVPIDQVAARAVDAAQTMAAGQTIHLERPRAPVYVMGDAARLEQVLLNLLTNAITYAPGSERIEVRVRRVGGEAELWVRDYGPGIPAADLPHVFARFYQVARADERPSRRGLGLGLYIAHELVAAHGGRIEVASVEGTRADHGTTFTIHLPLAPGDGGEN